MKVTKEIFLQCTPYSWQSPLEYAYSIIDFEMEGAITVARQIVTMEVPENFDFAGSQIEELEAKKLKVRAVAAVDIAEINEAIAALKVLEYMPKEES